MRHRTAQVVIGLLLVGACSVTTPRDEGLTVRGVTGGVAGEAEPGLGAVPGDDAAMAPDATIAGGAADPGALDPTTGGGPSGPADGSVDDAPGAPDASEGSARRVVGVTDDTIVVSVSWPFSGALGQLYQNFYSTALATWAEDVNERGGIHGRKVSLKKVDNGGTVDGLVAACREIQSNGSFVALTEGGTGDATSDCLDEAGFPAVQSTSATRSPEWRSVRTLSSSEAARTIGSYIRGPIGGAGKKVGVIYTDNFKSYNEATVEGTKAAGMQVVRTEPVARNQASFTSELLRLRQAGAEVVAILAAQEAIGILRDAKAIGYQPAWTGMLWVGDEFTVAAGDLMSGIKALRYWAATDSEAWRRYRALVAKHGNGTPTSASMALYGTAVVLGRALELAGPALNRDSLRAGFDRMDRFDSGVVVPVSFTGGRAVGSNAQFPVRCCNANREWATIGPASDRF